MNTSKVIEKIQKLEKDYAIQNMIAQANARYILFDTEENLQNFPKYTIKDDKLNILAFYYLNLGCSLAEEKMFDSALLPIEKAASILEYIHGSKNNRTNTSNYYGLISSLSYYVCFQYSKSFTLINKIEGDTKISLLLSLFLKRKFPILLREINKLVFNDEYSDKVLGEKEDLINSSSKIYEITIAKILNNIVKYFFTGEKGLLESAKSKLLILKEISEIRQEPDVWWIIRLLNLITDGFDDASLWNSLGKYYKIDSGKARKYIQSLIFMKRGGVYELFITQRQALDKVLSSSGGSVISIPTSSGKTRIAEIAILDWKMKNEDSKILFIAPFRSLAFEIENTLDEIFKHLDISVSHLYGGSLFNKLDAKIIDESDVIVATPEKAKAMMRSNIDTLNNIQLVIIDEGHLLGADKRLIVNEMFYEELRYFIKKNNGKFLVLSAILPNPSDIAIWLTNSEENTYKNSWRLSDERIGILEWNGNSVSLNWQSSDKERNSYNPNFIIREKLPKLPRQRKTKYFPSDKNDAVAATAFKLRVFGTVLIFVGLKSSVFTIAKSYYKCLGDNPRDFDYVNNEDWKSFELACVESYGIDCEWLKYARKGILCHNSDLHIDVRIPLERLMRKEKPLVIICTSTLGQGVNLGVSTVIFSTISQAGAQISHRDFWNIAGRAGRAFVDHEGKILVALDSSNKSSQEAIRKTENTRRNIVDYFDKQKIDNPTSGLLTLIKKIKLIAEINGMSLELLFQLITENNIDNINSSEAIDIDSINWIDDSLLALHCYYNEQNDSIEDTWIDTHFKKSLAYLQTSKTSDITGDDIMDFIHKRINSIISLIGNNKETWNSHVNSGIPLNCNLKIDSFIPNILIYINQYCETECSIDNKIDLLRNIEMDINSINILNAEYLQSEDLDSIRTHWLHGDAMSIISGLKNASEIIVKHYSFNLPWILNGLSKKLYDLLYVSEAEIIEELAMLVEIGLPNLKSIKVYQAGIRSRVSAKEIGELFIDELWDRSIKSYKNDLITYSEYYQGQVSQQAAEWIDLLKIFSNLDSKIYKPVPNFTYGNVHEKVQRLIARKINGKQYLISPDFNYIAEDTGNVDFSPVNDLNGVYFDYNTDEKVWKMNCENPFLYFEESIY